VRGYCNHEEKDCPECGSKMVCKDAMVLVYPGRPMETRYWWDCEECGYDEPDKEWA